MLAGRLRALAMAALAVVVAGCVVAVGAAAAGGGIYYTKRGAETTIAAPIGRVFVASRRALADMGIRQTEAELKHEDDDDEEEEREAEIEGEGRDLEVKVTLKAKGRRPTRVRVVAKRGEFGWDKDFARAVLERIVVLAH